MKSMPDPNKLVLTEADRQSALWHKLKEHFEARLSMHRAQNDGDLTEERTSRLRGRIAECKYLLGLDKPTPTVVDDR